MLRVLNPHGVSMWQVSILTKDLSHVYTWQYSLAQLRGKNSQDSVMSDELLAVQQLSTVLHTDSMKLIGHCSELIITTCQRKVTTFLKSDFFWLALVIYYPEKAEMAIKTKAWASCCTNLGTTSTHFVIISVCSSQIIKGKEKKRCFNEKRVWYL